MNIDPGKFADRIILLKRDKKIIEEPVYYEVPYWREIGGAWCQYRPTGGREFREGNIAVGEERATFTTPFRMGLTILDRLVFQGKIWDIKSINRVGHNVALDINAISTGQAYVPEDE